MRHRNGLKHQEQTSKNTTQHQTSVSTREGYVTRQQRAARQTRSILNFFTRNANQPEVAGQINDGNDDTTGEDAAESDNGNNSVEHDDADETDDSGEEEEEDVMRIMTKREAWKHGPHSIPISRPNRSF